MLNTSRNQLVLELLWRATWQSAVLAAIVCLFLLAARKRIAPRWRVGLLAIPLLRLVILVVPASSLSVFNVLDSRDPLSVSVFVPDITASQFHLVLNESLTISSTGGQGSLVASPSVSQAMKESVSSNISSVHESNTASVVNEGLTYLFWVWAAGCSFSVLVFLASRIQLSSVIAHAQPLDRPDITERTKSRCQSLGIRRSVQCLVVDCELGPASIGLLRPSILFPRSLLSELNVDQLSAIVDHELHHIRRLDCVYLFMSHVACCLHWFNPLAHCLSRRIRAEIELAVDAATVEHIDEQSRVLYGNLLLQLALRRSRSLGLAPMADRRSNLKQRIDELTSPTRITRLRTLFSLVVTLLLVVIGLSDVANTQEKAVPVPVKESAGNTTIPANQSNLVASNEMYFIEGKVTDEVTGKAVSDAVVQFLIPSEQDITKRLLTTRSDESGHYRIAVPLGAVRLWFPALKPGYWINKPADNTTQFSISKNSPIVEHNIVATPAPIWNVSFSGQLPEEELGRIIAVKELPDDDLRRKAINGETWSSQKPINEWNSILNDDRSGALTQIGESGKLFVRVGNASGELIIESGFDNAQIASAKKIDGNNITEMRDAKGLKATISNANVTLKNGTATLRFDAPDIELSKVRLTGQVVDGNSLPVVGAEIRIASREKMVGGIWPHNQTSTDAQGRFNLDVELAQDWKRIKNSEITVAANIRHDGMTTIDSRYVPWSENNQHVELGTIVLDSGHSLRVRVLDSAGAPAAGAALTLTSQVTQAIIEERTDSDGLASLHGLPADIVRIIVSSGAESATSKVIVDGGTNEETIRLEPRVTKRSTSPARQEPLPVGEQAPEWTVEGWSDSKIRKLSDYRGKVVVIDFWGLWCGSCITSLPATQKIATEYENQGVVFLGIHTADGDLEQIAKLKKLKGWSMESALDKGTSVQDSDTWRAFGVTGAPTWVIIDQDGRIAYRTDLRPQDMEAFMEEQRKMAEAFGLPWPLPQDGTPEEMNEIANKLVYANLSQALQSVIAKR